MLNYTIDSTKIFFRFFAWERRHGTFGMILKDQLLAGPAAARAYLAHMVLRQVDWSLRHHPAAAATRRHLRVATAITADIDRSPAR